MFEIGHQRGDVIMTATTASERNGMGSGWVTFAGVLFVVAGCANLIWGIGALAKKEYLLANGVLFSTLQTWGWIAIIWGVVVLVGAMLVLGRVPSGPVVGIILATISAVVWLFLLPVLPIFALVAIILDVLVIYGLASHGLEDRS